MTAAPGLDHDGSRLELVAVGEPLVQLTPAEGGHLAAAETLRAHTAGAEVNLAAGLALLGHRVGIVSRVGADPFGQRILDDLRRAGVDISELRVDPDAPTGVYFKDPTPGRSRMYYYRRGSAATRLGPTEAQRALAAAAVVHVSGITAALGPSCQALVRRILDDAEHVGVRVSFDVNHRPALWPSGDASAVLLELARRAHTVFVGRDEAEALWGTASAQEVRGLLRDVPVLVVKDEGATAVAFSGRDRADEPALRVPVVEPIGAGDAFAAGYLSAALREQPIGAALRRGHLLAAGALLSDADHVPPPPTELLDAALKMEAADWAGDELLQHPYLRPRGLP